MQQNVKEQWQKIDKASTSNFFHREVVDGKQLMLCDKMAKEAWQKSTC